MKSASFVFLLLFSAHLLFAESDALRKTALELAAGIQKQGNVKVAVLGFPYHDNHKSEGSLFVADQLTSGLAACKKVNVVERQHLMEALGEMHLAATGLLDPETTKSLGQSLGADVIVTGTLINLPGNRCEINARALLSKNGRVVAASRATIDRAWSDRNMLASGRRPLAPNALKLISRKLAAGVKANLKTSLVVLDFPYSRNRFSTGSHLVSEQLLTYLVQEGVNVIERRLLEKILEERKLWETGLMGPESERNMGTIVGADAVVTGLLSDLSDSTCEVLARVVKVDSGEIMAAASLVIDRLWSDPPRLPRIAQPRSAVPVAYMPVEPAQSPALHQQPSSGKRQRYFPAPVPFIMPKGRPAQ